MQLINLFWKNKMNVLFEDNEIIVLVKPVGIPSEDTPNGEKGIIDLLKFLC